MTTENLEQVKETVEPIPKAEEETPSQPTEETSPETKTLPLRETPEFKEELEKAQSGWDKRNKLLETKLSQAKAEAKAAQEKHDALVAEREADATLAKVLKKYEEAGGDVDEVDELSKALRAANRAKAEADKKMAEAVQKEHDLFMANKAVEYSKQYGIPIDDFPDCDNEYELLIAAQQYQLDHPKKSEESPKTPKPDSLLGAGGGINWRELSPEAKIKRGLGKR
jgi:hypothetical protein